MALLNEHHDILQLKPKMVFFAVLATSGLYIPLSGVHSIAICDVTPTDSSAEGKIVMGERAALAAPQTIFSSRVDSAAKSEAGFDIYIKKKVQSKFAKSVSMERLGAVQWYNVTDVSALSVPALTASLIHFRQH